jgi:hypothetical protein
MQTSDALTRRLTWRWLFLVSWLKMIEGDLPEHDSRHYGEDQVRQDIQSCGCQHDSSIDISWIYLCLCSSVLIAVLV